MNTVAAKRTAAALLIMGACLPSVRAAEPTPPEVWKDYDPDKGDFKEEIVKEETRAGIYYRESYISAYVLGEEIRVFCKYSVKAGARNAPGLMDVHGWYAFPRISPEYVNNGWAVLAHGYAGSGFEGREHYTRYPKTLARGNMKGPLVKSRLPDGADITDPGQTSDYVWYAVQRRALSYLLAQQEVDPDRIGAKGFSYGGTIMWNLGMDTRVKAIVAYFGIGWLEYYRTRGVWMYDVPPKEPPMTPGEKLYLSAIAPQAHAPYITAASLWLNGSNDHHGGHERGIETFKMFKPGVPWDFAIQARGHHNTEKLGDDCRLWLEKYVLGKDVFWPARPASGIRLDTEGVPELRVTPASPEKITDIKAWYALKNPVSFGRTWRDTELVQTGDGWAAKMPVLNVDDYVFAFANISYGTNLVVSSGFNVAVPSKLGSAMATDKRSNVISEGTGQWSGVAPVEGIGGIQGFRPLNNQRGTASEQFSDPKWKAPDHAQLSFMFYCTQPQALILSVNGQFETEIVITASDDWQTLVLPAPRLRNKNNQQPMPHWGISQKVQLRPAPGTDITKILFAKFQWVLPDQVSERPEAPQIKTSAYSETMSETGPRYYLTPERASLAESFLKVTTDEAWNGGPIRIGGQVYERGLGVHAESRLVFPLKGQYRTFHVIPGPDDSHMGLIEMKIFLDGKEVYSSGKTKSNDASPRPALDLPVTGVKTLTLTVDSADGSIGGDHASWADAYLLK